MALARNEAAKPVTRVFAHSGPPPNLGQVLHERQIPSDAALVTPLVVRAVEFLKGENLVPPGEESKIALCFEEALQNAVKHGNKGDFKKMVKFQIFLGGNEWGAAVTDEGAGFDLSKIASPVQPEGLWGESGRGVYLMSHYMDRVEYYLGGSTLVMFKHL